ncbi:MAG: hypothetical protein SOW57_04635, partial [Prevotella sp.]|nr:hypothetical protein [Prevotella sp.]
GLIDEEEKSIFHTVYKEIEPYVWGVCPGYGRRQLYMLGDNFELDNRPSVLGTRVLSFLLSTFAVGLQHF